MTFDEWKLLFHHQRKHHAVLKAFLRSFRRDLQRQYSRQLISKYIQPTDRGLELGSGEWTIAPISQTVLSDAHETHAGATSLAREFFSAEKIPYPDHSFDFILNEHVLEHLPDPITAIIEWQRVLKPNGKLFLFLPHHERTFDRLREPTTIEHLFRDHELKVESNEDFHWNEWKEKVLDQKLAPHYQQYGKTESLQTNVIHRHVFTSSSIQTLFEKLGWKTHEVIDQVRDRGDSFCVILSAR
jgi:ubiquinone/menaquinone biosynthesis C-methylase UbiE